MSNHIAETLSAPFEMLDKVLTKSCSVGCFVVVVVYHIVLIAIGAVIGRAL